MADLIAPTSGDVLVHCCLPSGSRLELQMYFQQGEDARHVVTRELAKENLAQAHLPQILSALKDIFLTIRRKKPLSDTISKPNLPSHPPTDPKSVSFTRLFTSQTRINHLKVLKNEAKTLYSQLMTDKEAFNQQFQSEDIRTYEEKVAVDRAEMEFSEREKAIKESFWLGIEMEGQEIGGIPSIPAVSAENYEKNYLISVGMVQKRHLKLQICLRNDMFLDETSPEIVSEMDSIRHSENIYSSELSVLCLPVSTQDNSVSVLPDLIRKCEETPELHFASIRTQMGKFEGMEGKGSFVGFTRHSNIGLAKGAFHVGSLEAMRGVLGYCDRNYVSRVIVPVGEWTEEREEEGGLVRVIKQGVSEWWEGDLKEVVLVVDTDEEDCKRLQDVVETVFAEEICP